MASWTQLPTEYAGHPRFDTTPIPADYKSVQKPGHGPEPEDDWRKHDARFNEPQLSRNLDLVERLKAVADGYNTTPGAVAVAWALRNPAIDGAIVGFRRPDQVDPILPAAVLELSDEDRTEIEGDKR